MNGAREGRALGQHGESIAQVSHVVLGLHFVSVERCVTLNYKININRYLCTEKMSRDATSLLLT